MRNRWSRPRITNSRLGLRTTAAARAAAATIASVSFLICYTEITTAACLVGKRIRLLSLCLTEDIVAVLACAFDTFAKISLAKMLTNNEPSPIHFHLKIYYQYGNSEWCLSPVELPPRLPVFIHSDSFMVSKKEQCSAVVILAQFLPHDDHSLALIQTVNPFFILFSPFVISFFAVTLCVAWAELPLSACHGPKPL